MCWRLGRFGRRPHAFGVTVRNRPHFPARGWLRGQEWERITRGVYAAALSRTQLEELAAWQLVLPRTAAFSHLTAARLRGWWLPATIAHPVFAAMLNADPRPPRPGLLVCRHTQPFPINLVSGLRITTAAETILAVARPRCPRSGYPRRLGAAALHSDRSRGDGATIIADADRLLGRAWNPRRLARGRACSTTRFLDGLAAPAPTATGGEPLPKPVRCNTEKPAICVPDRLREDGSGALLAALTLGELFAWHQSRQHRVTDDFCGDDHLCDVITTGNVVHDIEQDLFEDRPQAAGAGAA
jgi:hypothetical protein